MHRISIQLFLGILSIGTLGVLTVVGTTVRRPARRPDLIVLELRTNVVLKRHVRVEATIANRGQRQSAPTVVQFRSTAWTPAERPLAELGAGEEIRVSFVSPAINQGDHQLMVRVDPEASQPDLDEANNVRTAMIRLAEAAGGTSVRTAPVPSVLGKTEKEALRTLRRAGLSLDRVYHHARGTPTGVVAEQWPDPGARVAGRSGALVVLGAQVSVPEIRGLSVADARSVLRQSTLEIGTIGYRPSTQDWSPKVVAQRPSPGTLSDLRAGVHVEVIDPTPAWTFAAAAFMGLGTLGFLIARRSGPARARKLERRRPPPTAETRHTRPSPAGDEPRLPESVVESSRRSFSVLHSRPSQTEHRRAHAVAAVPTRPSTCWTPHWDPGVQELSWTKEAAWRWHWDPGTQTVAWNLETSQPTFELVLVSDAGETKVEDHAFQGTRSQIA